MDEFEYAGKTRGYTYWKNYEQHEAVTHFWACTACGCVVAVSKHANDSVRFDGRVVHRGACPARVASGETCPHGDQYCPCPDGDPCHYEPVPSGETQRDDG